MGIEQLIIDIYNQIPNIGTIAISGYLLFFRKEMNQRFDKTDLNVLRLRILNLIQHSPNQTSIIQKLYTEYKLYGGNCEIDDVYTEWKMHYKQLKTLNPKII